MSSGKYSSGGSHRWRCMSLSHPLLEAFRAGEGVDLVRESVRLVVQELLETEATEVDRSRPLRTQRDPREPPGRDKAPADSDAGRGCRVASPEVGAGLELPWHPRKPAPDRPSPVCGGDGGLGERCLHPLGRRPGGRVGHRVGVSKSEVSRICAGLDEQVDSLPGPAAAPHRVPLCVPGCHLPAYPPLRPGGGQAVWGWGQGHPGWLRLRGQGVLARVPPHPQAERPARCPARHLHRHAGLVAALGPSDPRGRASTLPRPLRPQSHLGGIVIDWGT